MVSPQVGNVICRFTDGGISYKTKFMSESISQAGAGSSSEAQPKKGPVTELVEKCAALEKECAEHKEQYVRSLAEFENYRRRMQREFEMVRQSAIESVVCELLPVLDSFDRALAMLEKGTQTSGAESSVGEGEKAQTDSGLNAAREKGAENGSGRDDGDKSSASAGYDSARSVDKLREGIVLIRRQLAEALARQGVEEYSCLGEEFDPRRAEAISFVHTEEHKPDTVVAEQCKGFSCRGKVIRPAKVIVAKPAQGSRNLSEQEV